MVHAAPASAETPAPNAVPAPGSGRTVAGLQHALTSARTIGMAVGLTMRDRRLTQAAAHAYLVRASQNTNVKLRVLAGEIVAAADSSPRGNVRDSSYEPCGHASPSQALVDVAAEIVAGVEADAHLDAVV